MCKSSETCHKHYKSLQVVMRAGTLVETFVKKKVLLSIEKDKITEKEQSHAFQIVQRKCCSLRSLATAAHQ